MEIRKVDDVIRNTNENFNIQKPTDPNFSFNGLNVQALNIQTPKLFAFSYAIPEIPVISTPIVNPYITHLESYNNFSGANITVLGTNQDIPSGSYNVGSKNAITTYINYAGQYQAVSDAVITIDRAGQRAITIDNSQNSGFTNNGKIFLTAENSAGLEIQSGSAGATEINEVINNGEIHGENDKQAAFIFTDEAQYSKGLIKFTNAVTGIVELNGEQSSAIVITGSSAYAYIIQGINNGTITLNGIENYGLALGANGDLDTGSQLLNTGTININNNNSGGISVQSMLDSSTLNTGTINITGSSSDTSFGIYSKISNELLNEGSININASESSIGLRTDAGNLTNGINGVISIDDGNNNAGMLAKMNGTVTNHGNILIENGTNNIGAIIDSSVGVNDGTMKIEGSNSKGVVVTDNGTFTNTGSLTINGDNSYGLLSEIGTINGGTVNMDLTDKKSVGVYVGNDSTISTDLSTINVTGGNILLEDGGVNFIATNNGTLNLQNLIFETGQTGLSFYTLDNGAINISNSTGTVKGGTSSLERGTAFSIVGNGVTNTIVSTSTDLENLLSNSGITLNNLTLNMEAGARVFSLGEASVNLSVVNQIETGGFSNITINGNDYIMFMLYKGLLNLDSDSDLDDPDNDYEKVELSNSSITNQMTINGTQNAQLGIAQENGEDGLGNDYVKSIVTLTNDGIIDLKGTNSVGIYTDNGIIKNNAEIKTTGSDSYGIYGVNGTEITTSVNSAMEVGVFGTGILAVSYKIDPVTKLPIEETFGDGSFKIEHNGIIAINGNNSYGIYANNNDDDLGTLINTRTVNLNSGSSIDLSLTTDSGTGILLNKSTLYNSGTIKVGTKGTGIYSKDSSVNLDGSTLDILGDNSYGIVLDGNNTFTSTGAESIVNVSGNNTIVFISSNSPGGNYNVGNMTVNGNDSSQLTLAATKDNTFLYDGKLTGAGINSVIIAGNNSDIGFGSNAIINSTSNEVTGLFSKGKSAQNNGKIALNGDKSIGIYAENGNALNGGEVAVETSGVGIYNTNGSIDNFAGKISVGENGVGVYGDETTTIRNNALINSNNDSSIGIYSVGDTSGTNILNDTSGILELGINGVGIYTSGNSQKSITNNGDISVGDTILALGESFGIYSGTPGNTIINNGNILSGNESIGIYSIGGNIISSGDITTGNESVGIYSNGGTVDFSSDLVIGANKSIGVYGINGANVTNTSSNIKMGDSSYAFVLLSGSSLVNKGSGILSNDNVFVYKDGTGSITSDSGSTITSTGSDNIAFYMTNGGTLYNESDLILNSGIGNIGIYSEKGSVVNKGDILVGDSSIVKVSGTIDPNNSLYSAGIYADNTSVINYGNINAGENALGLYSVNSPVVSQNYGNITGNSAGAIGMYTENSAGLENHGNISLTGDNVVGIAGKTSGRLVNYGNISVSGNNAVGMYGVLDTLIDNEGTINVSGKDAVGMMAQSGDILNNGTINVSNGATMFTYSNSYEVPSIINAGVIKVDERFDLDGLNLTIKVDKSTFTIPTANVIFKESYAPEDVNAKFLVSSATTIVAPSFNFGDGPIGIDESFTQGTNSRVYKFENVFDPLSPSANSGDLSVKSNSLTFNAVPSINDNGKIDVWMEKINYSEFTQERWYDEFAKNIESSYESAAGDALKLYDKLDLITKEDDLEYLFDRLAGNMYSNINKREEDISNVFKNTLYLLQNSENNTKENVKIGVIGGKGSTKEDTYGVPDYDYDTFGVLALREVERTFRHKFGYSLGYTRTDFQMDEALDEDQADTIQLGLHNKYSTNGWNIKNDILGKVSFHNVNRGVNWTDGTTSDLESNYNVYGVSSLNELGKDLNLGENVKIVPYVGLELGYMMHPSFEESGSSEKLKIDSNDAYSIKPNLGVRFEGEKTLGKQANWKIKGNIGIGYEYELGDMNKREKVSLAIIEDGFHYLAESEEENGMVKTSAYFGVESHEKYGVYVTGEYGIGDNSKEDYKLGVVLKATF